MNEWQVALLMAALGFAGLVKGTTGMGLPLFATPILAGVFGARSAVVIMSIPIFVTNLLLLYEGRRLLSVFREVWVIALAGAAGVVVGLVLLVRLDQNLLALFIALLVFLFILRGERLLGDDPRAVRMRVMAPVVGVVSGILNGSTSIASPAIAGYLHARRLTPREFVVSLALIFQVYGTIQVLGLWRLGLYDQTVLTMGFAGLAPTLLTFFVGQRLRARLDNATFRTAITILLLVSALNLIIQGLRGLGILA